MEQPRLVTPEAVVLSFETAGLGSRVPAMLIDLAIQGGVLLLGALGLGLFGAAVDGGTADVVATVFLLLLVTGVLLGYPIAFETLWRGRTPGKAALGLRVVTTEGAPVRFRHAAVRGFLGLIDLWATTGAVAVLSVLLSRDNQRLGDMAAGTFVLRERSGAGRPRVAAFPPPYGLEAYTATLDVAGLSPDEYGAVRSFLLRAPSLPPPVRAGLAADLAATVAARMRHTAPPWLPPEPFLACVAAATQARSAPAAPPVAAWSEAAAVWGRATPAGPAAPPSVPTPVPRPARDRRWLRRTAIERAPKAGAPDGTAWFSVAEPPRKAPDPERVTGHPAALAWGPWLPTSTTPPPRRSGRRRSRPCCPG